MFAKTYGATTFGVDGRIIDVEVDSAGGLPAFDIVGLPDTAVREAKERVRTALKNSGMKLRAEKVTVNLAPADLRKDSPGLDLPIAIGLLLAYGLLPEGAAEDSMFAAELSLEGELRPVQGILSMAIQARQGGFKKFFVAKENANEALLVDGLTVYAAANLTELIPFLSGVADLSPAKKQPATENSPGMADDFSDVQGQFFAKRALEIAAAGGHNILMVGAPGSGKTMLARRLSSILPALTQEEALEVTKIYSIAGLLPRNGGLMTKRPFRSPHHTVSTTALIGGGSVPRPGEVTLAHHGVLFLDELPEFSKTALEALRQPLEDRQTTISRIHSTITYPSSILLVVSLNPCPCGYYGVEDGSHKCECTPNEIKRYMRKISGPLLDRIDIHIRVPRVEYKDLSSVKRGESSASVRARVEAAREKQLTRLHACGIYCNAQMNHAMLREFAPLEPAAQSLLEQAFNKLNLSARSYDRIIKVARTVADLAGADTIGAKHIGEAIKLRSDVGINIE
ncbi:MAG: YifB family Mg chelatase-like AAA ATPase [Selenomonadaceae bacterium]|nr:YifB family Mg chelatase-like AAA ATPase [Selenomonadaceae bacterium]